MRIRFSPTTPSQREDVDRLVSVEKAMWLIRRCHRPTSQIIDRLHRKWCGLEDIDDGRRTRTPDSFRYGLLALIAMFKVDDEMEFDRGEFRGVMRKIKSGEFARLVMHIGGVRWTASMQRTFLTKVMKAKIVLRTNPYKSKGRITELWLGLDASKLLEDIQSVEKSAKKAPVLCRVAEDPDAKRRMAINRHIDPKKGTPSPCSSVPEDQKKSTPSASLPGVESFSLVEDGTTREKLVPGEMVPVLQGLKSVFPDDEITETHISQLVRWWNHRQEKSRLTLSRFEEWRLWRDTELDADGLQCSLHQFCKRWSWVWREVQTTKFDQRGVGISVERDVPSLEAHAMGFCVNMLEYRGPNLIESLIEPDTGYDRDPLQLLCRFIIATKLEIPLEWMHAFVEPVTKIMKASPDYFVMLTDANYPVQSWLGLTDTEARQMRRNAVALHGRDLRERTLVQQWAN